VRVLGARLVWDNGQMPPSFLMALSGGAMLEIYPANAVSHPGRGDNQQAGFRHVALRVDSIGAAKAELSNRGVKFDEETRPAAGGERCYSSKTARAICCIWSNVRRTGSLAKLERNVWRRSVAGLSDYFVGLRRTRRWRCLTNTERVFLLTWCSMPSASRWATASGTPSDLRKSTTIS